VQDLLSIEDVEQAAVLLKPARLEVLRRMAEEITCTELAALVGSTPQKVHYHVKALEGAGLVEKVAERKVRGILEGIYRARARSYWLSPRLVGQLGGARASADQASLGYLIQLAEEVQEDVAAVAERAAADGEPAPSLGLSAQIVLRDAADRAAFMRDVQHTFQQLAERYGARSTKKATTYRIALACYPKEES
jgi:DNA-binding transcriptional ArsR family regulator